MSQEIFNREIDQRTVNCRHARLREALQFRPSNQMRTLSQEVEKLAEATIYEAPKKDESEVSWGLQIFKSAATLVLTCVSFLVQPI